MSNHARRSNPAAYWRYSPDFAVRNAASRRLRRAALAADLAQAQHSQRQHGKSRWLDRLIRWVKS
jgi:hypothetical protein